MEILRRKVYHRKSEFFEMTKIEYRLGFRTSQKNLTPLLDKTMLYSLILKKYHRPKGNDYFRTAQYRLNTGDNEIQYIHELCVLFGKVA